MSPRYTVRNVNPVVGYDEDFFDAVAAVADTMESLGKPVDVEVDDDTGLVTVSGCVASHVADAVDMLTGPKDVELVAV